MKKFTTILLSLCVLFALTGCVQAGDESNTKTVTDCAGVEVKVPEKIEKVISVNQSFCAFMTAMGIADKLIGAHGSVLYHSWSPVFYEGFSTMQRYGYQPSAEAIYAAGADLVVLNDKSYAEDLRKVGIAAIYFNYTNLNELIYGVDLIGELFGADAQAYVTKWKTYLNTTIDTITADVAKVPHEEVANVYYVNAATDAGLYNTFGGGSFVEYWITTIGARLVTSPYRDVTNMEAETVLSLNPDTIFLSGYLEYDYADALRADPLWADIDAVKAERIYVMPTRMVSYDRFAVELPMLLSYSANVLYPNYHEFGGIAELKTFYQNYYDLTFSDDQLTNMLAGLNPDGTRMQ